MVEGAPDYTHLRQILARDALGNLVPVACDPSGRIILLPYGTQTVAQDDPTRTVQGADGLTLHTLAVDAQGRLVMLPYGWDGATYRPLKVDNEGRMIGVMKGQADVKWGLRGWWKFVASEGTTIKDYSGYGNDGSALSGVGAEAKYEDGVIGQALEFDGDNDYVNCGSGASFDFDTAFTLELWVKPKVEESMAIFAKSSTLGAVGLGFVLRKLSSNRWNFVVYNEDGDKITLSCTSVPNTWQHLVAVYTGTIISIYVNSVLDDSLECVGYSPAPAQDLILGKLSYSDGHYYDGLMDEARVYARALSQDEINWRYANTNPAMGKPTRMIAVDSEGRMEVNLKDLPYKDQVLERFQLLCSPAGNYNLQSSVVPQGKLWIINVCNAYVDTAKIDTIDIGIYDGLDNFIVAYEYGTGLVGWVNIQAPLILKAGDLINAGYVAVGNNGVINLVLNGYELDAS